MYFVGGGDTLTVLPSQSVPRHLLLAFGGQVKTRDTRLWLVVSEEGSLPGCAISVENIPWKDLRGILSLLKPPGVSIAAFANTFRVAMAERESAGTVRIIALAAQTSPRHRKTFQRRLADMPV